MTEALRRSWAKDLDARTLYELLKLRVEVFVVEQACPYPELDGRDLLAETRHFWLETPAGGQAVVWVADGRATALRRAGRPVSARQLAGRDGDVIELDIGSADGLAREVAGYGADAIVLEPQSLRDDVLIRLRAQAGERR